MKILFLAAEAESLAGAGGSDEMAGSLPHALAALGHDVRAAVPFSTTLDRDRFEPARVARLVVPQVGGEQVARVSEVRHAGVTYYLIAGPAAVRGGRAAAGATLATNGSGEIFNALAALGICRALAWTPNVVHAVTSQAGAALYWLDTDGLHDEQFQQTAAVFTVRGLGDPQAGVGPGLRAYGVPSSDSPLLPDWARDTMLGLCLAHAGLLVMDSLTDGQEMLSSAHGRDWVGVLQARREQLNGLRVGLDIDRWDPRRDKSLAARYDADRLDRRAANKRALQRATGLAHQAQGPLIGVVTPQDRPTEAGIAASAVRAMLAGAEHLQFVVFGTAQSGKAAEFRRLATEFPEQVRLRDGMDHVTDSHIFAGVDILLVVPGAQPSALVTLLALRYGAVPMVPASGALSDVVIDYSQPRRGSGFVFTDYNAPALLAGLQRALRVYRRPAHWRALQRRAMRQALEFTWARSAQHYLTLYQQALTFRKEAVTALTHRLADGPAGVAPGTVSDMAGAGQATLR